MQENRVKRVMRDGDLAIGAYVSFADPAVVEIIGLAGFDAAFIDMEHTAIDLAMVETMVRTAELAGVASLIRVYENDPGLILRILDMGAQGIIIPHVEGLEGAKRAVEAVRYPPVGKRGAAGSTRAASYGAVPWREHVRTSNEEILLSVMAEDDRAFDDIEAMAGLEGLDLVAVGPADLTETLGVTDPKDPRLKAKVEEIAGRIGGVGKAKFSLPLRHPAYPLGARELKDLGVGYTHVNPPPYSLVLNGLREAASRVREESGR